MPALLDFPMVSPDEWGARVDYDSRNWLPWNPDKWVVHYWGGWIGAGAEPFTVEKETARLRGGETYHIDTKDWLGIAYNYAIGQTGTLYRLRGEQRSGATSGDADADGIPENNEARAVVFILGGNQEPSEAALDTFSRFWATDPKPVIGHRDSTNTPCPGDHLYAWIRAKGYETMPFTTNEIETVQQLHQVLVDEGVPRSNIPAVFQTLIWLHRNRKKIAAVLAAGGAGVVVTNDMILDAIRSVL